MFLSTVIPSTLLDVNHLAAGATVNKFSVPYNFVRGRNIVINANTKLSVYQNNSGFDGILNGGLGFIPGATNIVIPDNVDVHTANIDIVVRLYNGSTQGTYKHTLQVTFDTVNNIITFVPTATSMVAGTQWENYNTTWVIPVLLVIETIL